jgi:hypothetical protein
MPWGAIYSTSMYSASVADKSEKVAISLMLQLREEAASYGY